MCMTLSILVKLSADCQNPPIERSGRLRVNISLTMVLTTKHTPNCLTLWSVLSWITGAKYGEPRKETVWMLFSTARCARSWVSANVRLCPWCIETCTGFRVTRDSRLRWSGIGVVCWRRPLVNWTNKSLNGTTCMPDAEPGVMTSRKYWTNVICRNYMNRNALNMTLLIRSETLYDT